MGQEDAAVYKSTNSETSTSVSSEDAKSCASKDQVKSKMEALQQRINELKEKVKYEGEFLTNEERSISLENQDSSFTELATFNENSQEKSTTSDSSLYFSASNFSFGSMSSDFSDTQDNFSKFISKFVRNQNYKERLSLLQLHSSKQISINMMRRSLVELDSRCTQELEVIEKSLRHLEKLAAEINRSSDEDHTAPREQDGGSRRNWKSKTEEFLLNNYDTCRPEPNSDSGDGTSEVSNDVKIRKSKTMSFLWTPLERKSQFEIDWKKNPAFVKPAIEETFDKECLLGESVYPIKC